MRIPFILSGALAALLVFLMNATVQKETGLNITGIPAVRAYDYKMVGLDYIQYDTQGMPSYRLIADSITHFPNPEYDAIVAPNFEIYRDQATSWTINATRGRSAMDSQAGEKLVALNDNVVIHGQDSRGREFEIFTDLLNIYPDSNNVSTDSDVRIDSESSQVTGTGMSADLDTSQIKLLANVRGKYGNEPEITSQGADQ